MKRFLLFSLPFIAIALLFFDFEGLATVFKTSKKLSGFSPDSRYYIYLESSRNSVTDVPTAQIQIIDVATNSCVKNGCLKTDYDNSSSNLSTQAAENDLLNKTLELRHTLKLTQLKVGIQLPIISHPTGTERNSPTGLHPTPLRGAGKGGQLPSQRTREPLPPLIPASSSLGQGGFESNKPDKTESVEVRLNNQPLQIRLEQKYIPSAFSARGFGDVERASMRLMINYNSRKLTLGNLNNYREAVKNYAIREVRLSPNGRNVVVLINETQPTYEGVLETTFVQSFPI